MQPVNVPTTDVNSEEAVMVEWMAADGSPVRKGEVVAEVETSKSAIEVDAPADGFLLHDVAEGADFPLDRPIARLFDSLDELEQARAAQPADDVEVPRGRTDRAYRATRSAQELADRHGIDLASLDTSGLITSADVEAVVGTASAPEAIELPTPLAIDDGRRRLLLVGGGLGATQVLDILAHDDGQVAVAIVDDDHELWGSQVGDVPVVGGSHRLDELFGTDVFDAAIVTISTSIAARTTLRELCEKHGIPLANAVDPTVRIAADVDLGRGNVICAFCHLGAGTQLGDNNFLSAYNSIDHHCVVGSDNSTGPGCMTSGLVTIGDRVRMGTGIFVEPKLRIGDDAVVASGAVIVTSVPDDHVVKAKAGSTVVTPRRT
jgi:sugar O-acyltransferase (sialic acid O-acetyltransferase NeuD family)